jgi:magnesium chelatase family protein
VKYSRLKTGAINGFNVEEILVEIDINSRSTIQNFKIVGMPATSIKESEKRILSSIRNSNYRVPNGSIIANLSPSSIKKEGSHFDLPVALSILEASKQIKSIPENLYTFGELGLNGEIRPVNGITLYLMEIKNKIKNSKFIIPRENQDESQFIKKEDIFVIDHIKDIEKILLGKTENYKPKIDKIIEEISDLDFSEIKGQFLTKRAIEIAACGFHNIIMNGPPGSGKTMIARRIPTILPNMTKEEIIETTKIYSISGMINKIIEKRPFRAPHHTASSASVIGGGSNPRPGEISLAHNGVLFMDEFPEYKTDVIEALRQPLEDGKVTIARSKAYAEYPAKFMLVAAQNPCPCGYYGDKEKECTCSMVQIMNYNKKISGPILDRIDIRISVPRVKIDELMSKDPAEKSENIKERVSKSALIQLKRQNKLNGKLNNKELKKFSNMSDKTEEFLKNTSKKLNLTARSVNRIIKVSRTIADMDEKKDIQIKHLAEAFNYRGKDLF